MGGGGSPDAVKPPAPAPMPQAVEETEEAKNAIKKRYRGRSGQESTILAGRLMSEKGKTLLGE